MKRSDKSFNVWVQTILANGDCICLYRDKSTDDMFRLVFALKAEEFRCGPTITLSEVDLPRLMSLFEGAWRLT